MSQFLSFIWHSMQASTNEYKMYLYTVFTTKSVEWIFSKIMLLYLSITVISINGGSYLIIIGHSMMAVDPEQKGDLLIRYLWEQGTNWIFYMRVVNMDVESCVTKTTDKILAVTDQDKKHKYLEACP